jgi:poly-gamma-glutamate synthesis protein (capsule biosynthesis protein)
MDEGIYRNRASFHEGFLVKLKIRDDFRSTMELVPFGQSDPLPGARKLGGERARIFSETMARKSKLILDDAFVLTQWLEFCEKHKHGYLSALLGHNRVIRKLNIQGMLTRLLYGKQQMLSVKNLVSCETHREAIETIFNHQLVRF